ncbi:DUF3299 domain-containing protein [Aestuariibacter halophilus]|uniref:DUF3299 domain-containing protein n=1 Tax=Fluctibacter halophilus TaxID=226011 RepID=A0ABS8GCR7_9ALTE|nr:DUF3299 domain-containing protein [Aestuariibacter halophilus]MCC2617625.1 DUF3299 domain-containing protein [Aestuariibacter halophilus]
MRCVVLFALLLSSTVFAEPPEVYWEDLVPSGQSQAQAPVNHDGSMVQQDLDAPVVHTYDGKTVKIPGFVVPLEGDGRNTTAFLLVPYFGACIHVPPPPPNQIVYVKFPDGVPIDNINDAIWVTGVLTTDGWQGDIATVGYVLEGKQVSPFEG